MSSNSLPGHLGEESLNELLLGDVGEVGLLGRLGLTHGLGLVDGNLGDLRHGERGLNLEVLRVEHGVGILHHDWLWYLVGRLTELVVDLRLGRGWGSDDFDNLGSLNLNLRGLVTAEKKFGLGLLNLGESLLNLSGLDQRLKGIRLGCGGLLVDLWGLLLGSKLLDNLLTLFAGGNSGVGVLQQSLKLVHLLNLGVVGLHSDEVGDANGQSSNESDEGTGVLKVLLVLLVRDLARGGRIEEGGEHGLGVDLSLLGSALLLELSGLLSEDSHGDVVGAAHRLLGWDGVDLGDARLLHGFLSSLNKDVVAMVFVRSTGLLEGLASLLVLLHGVKELVVGAAHVVGRALVIVGGEMSALVASLELLGAGSLGGSGHSLNWVGGVLLSHKLEEGSGDDKTTESANLLDRSTDGFLVALGGGLEATLGLGDNESPDGERHGFEDHTSAIILNFSGGSESVVLATVVLLVMMNGAGPPVIGHESHTSESKNHQSLGHGVHSASVGVNLLLVLLDILEELDGVLGPVEILVFNNLLEVLFFAQHCELFY